MNTLPVNEEMYYALDGSFTYLRELRLFFSCFNQIACSLTREKIDITKAQPWIEANLNIKARYFSGGVMRGDEIKKNEHVLVYVLDEPILIKLEGTSIVVLFEASLEAKARHLMSESNMWMAQRKRNTIGIVVEEHGELDTKFVEFRHADIDLAKHYNDDLLPIHQKLLSTINERERGGLILLHGTPGTGKSTYIRQVIAQTHKEVLFISPELALSLGSPEIARFLIRNAHTVMIMEDAERLMVTRDQDRNSAISTILNLTDGILGESLGIQIIATFNTELVNLDKALLRKGRMLARYEFKPLSREKSQLLLEELGYENALARGPMTLADIFNYEEKNFEMQRASIGFKPF